MSDLFKDIIPSILQNKKYVLDNEKDYNAYVINKALSFHYDCVMQANEMNKIPSASGLMQYHYLLNSKDNMTELDKTIRNESKADSKKKEILNYKINLPI